MFNRMMEQQQRRQQRASDTSASSSEGPVEAMDARSIGAWEEDSQQDTEDRVLRSVQSELTKSRRLYGHGRGLGF